MALVPSTSTTLGVVDASVPMIPDHLRLFFQYDSSTQVLIVTELSVRGRTPLQLQAELFALAEQFARRVPDIRDLQCIYDTQIADTVVEERFFFELEQSTEITVPHTRLGVIAHVIGAFLPRMTHLNRLNVHTCDHVLIRDAILRLNRLPNLFVIRNDCFNGYWNTASLAFFAAIRERRDAVIQQQYVAVVVAHTNSTNRFSAPEWALASFLWLRHRFNWCRANNSVPQVGSTYLLHDFADEKSWAYLNNAYELLLCATPPLQNQRQYMIEFQQVYDSDQSVLLGVIPNETGPWEADDENMVGIKYSTITPRRYELRWHGRNAFLPYLEQINGFHYQTSVVFMDSDGQPNYEFDTNSLVFGLDSPNKSYWYGPMAECEIYAIHCVTKLLTDDIVEIQERWFERDAFYFQGDYDPLQRQLTTTEFMLINRITDRLQATPSFDGKLKCVELFAECGGALAARELLRIFRHLGKLKLEIQQEALEDELDCAAGFARIIQDMDRIDELEIRFMESEDDPNLGEIDAALCRLRIILNAAFGDQDANGHGIRSLTLWNVHHRLVDAIMGYLFSITHPLSLIHIDVNCTVYANDDQDASIASTAARLRIASNSQRSTLCNQLVAFHLNTARVGDFNSTEINCVDVVLRECRALRHLVLYLHDLHEDAWNPVLQVIARSVIGNLETFHIFTRNDEFQLVDDGAWVSITAVALERGRRLVHFESSFANAAAQPRNVIDDILSAGLQRLTLGPVEQFQNSVFQRAPRELPSTLRYLRLKCDRHGDFSGDVFHEIVQLVKNGIDCKVIIELDCANYDRNATSNAALVTILEHSQRIDANGFLVFPIGAIASERRVESDALLKGIVQQIANDMDENARVQPPGGNQIHIQMQEIFMPIHQLLENLPVRATRVSTGQRVVAKRVAESGTGREAVEAKQLEEKTKDVDKPLEPNTKEEAKQLEKKTKDEQVDEPRDLKRSRIDPVQDLQRAIAHSLSNWLGWYTPNPAPLQIFDAPVVPRTQDARGRIIQDPRGNTASLLFDFHTMCTTVFEEEQELRMRWLVTLLPHFQDVYVPGDFRPEVQMASIRTLYQSAFFRHGDVDSESRSLLQPTTGCPVFGMFFDANPGTTRQGFETPGTRPNDEFADFRQRRYTETVAPGPYTQLRTAVPVVEVMRNDADLRGRRIVQENNPDSTHDELGPVLGDFVGRFSRMTVSSHRAAVQYGIPFGGNPRAAINAAMQAFLQPRRNENVSFTLRVHILASFRQIQDQAQTL